MEPKQGSRGCEVHFEGVQHICIPFGGGINEGVRGKVYGKFFTAPLNLILAWLGFASDEQVMTRQILGG